MDAYDFSGLTAEQEWLILCEGWQIGQRYPDGTAWTQPSKKVAQKLIDRGLMEAVDRIERSVPFSMTVTEYRVPIHVHMAYCMQCEDRA